MERKMIETIHCKYHKLRYSYSELIINYIIVRIVLTILKNTLYGAFQLTTFLNRLTGPPIGMTAAGMFVIDKSTILTVLCPCRIGFSISSIHHRRNIYLIEMGFWDNRHNVTNDNTDVYLHKLHEDIALTKSVKTTSMSNGSTRILCIN